MWLRGRMAAGWRTDRMEETGQRMKCACRRHLAWGQILFMETIWFAHMWATPNVHYTWSSFDHSVAFLFCSDKHSFFFFYLPCSPTTPPKSHLGSFFSTPLIFFLIFSFKNILLINSWQLQRAVLLHFSMATVSLFQRIPFQFW